MYCAYLLCYPDGVPFYAGAGSLSRAYGKNSRNKDCQSLIQELGNKTVRIIVETDTIDEAFEQEVLWIIEFGRVEFGGVLTNKTDGGPGSAGLVATDKLRASRAEAARRKVHSPESRAKISAAKLGKSLTIEHRRKIGLAVKARGPMSEETNRKISKALTGRQRSESHKRNISAACKGRSAPNKGIAHSEETCRKLKEAWVRRRARQESKSS